MDTDAAPAPLPPPFRWRRRIAWIIGLLLLGLLLLVIAAGGGLWWSLRSDVGSNWVLSQLPGVKVTRGHGTIWGDYDAEQVEFVIAGGGKVVMQGFGWRGMHLERAPWAHYGTRVVMNELHASRVELMLPPPDAKKEALRPPSDLHLPVGLEVALAKVGEFHTAALGAKPLHALQAKLQLGAERGALHRVDALNVAWDRMQGRGTLQIAAEAPFAIDSHVELAQDAVGVAPAWNASATLAGPLEGPKLAAEVRAKPTASRPEQSLSARAGLRPFAAWPLAELQASTKALDLSAFHSSAPLTALSGEASATSTGLDQPATVNARFSNAAAGRWNEGRLPLRELTLALRARPNDPSVLDVQAFDAELGTAQQSGGRLQGRGQWTAKEWKLDASLQSLQPSLLDARAAAMQLSGPVSVVGVDTRGNEPARIDLKAELSGQFAGRGPARAAQVALDASASMLRIALRDLRASAGSAKAALKGTAIRERADAPWQLQANLDLVDFDPAPWWPGREDSPWRKGPNRLNAKAGVDLVLPLVKEDQALLDALPALRGQAGLTLTRSTLAGVPLAAELALRSGDAGVANASLKLDAAGNSLKADGRISTARRGAADQWDVVLAAPALGALTPLWRASQGGADAGLAGALNATAHVSGRWPDIATQGQLDANGVRFGPTSVQRAQGRWNVDTSAANASADVQATLTQLTLAQTLVKGVPPIDSAQLQLKGTTRAHTLELRADTKALPPAWTDVVNRPKPGTSLPPAPPTSPASAAAARSLAVLVVQGGAIDAAAARGGPRFAGWRGTLQQLDLRSSRPDVPPWIRSRDIGIELQWANGPTRVALQPGRAELLGAALRWSRVSWQASDGKRPAQIDAQAELEPLTISPLLARFQPAFGWGGDLAVTGHLTVHSAPLFSADIVLERQQGDLTVTDETGTVQALGLTDLRLGLVADNGTWSFTQGLAGKTLGVAAGAVVARTTPQATWPAPETPIQGVLEVQVANLGTWGPWVPPGWRLTGMLRTSASIGGRFGAPEYTGEMRGSGIGARNFLEGVNVSDGDVAIALRGDTARIERFTAKAGAGTVKLEGNATFGEAPKALVKLQADKFQVLGRVDRRIVASGQAQLQLDRTNLALDGQFGIDEGLFDFTRSDAPSLSDDVRVVRGKHAADEPAPNANPAPGHDVKLNLQVSLGQSLRLRGRGIDTGLRGALHITSPHNRLAIAGTVQAVEGTYAAYAQKLQIDRGQIIFNGPPENPRLDIEATRPNLDVRVGVQVSGTALNPRVRLFSEPEMSEMDKLSWLVLGRGSDTLGRTDTALLQRAAMALLAG
ncbi:MAG TPA: translocation/assembly module TamB domain-containing protein, partial [Albitalea sp.]|nr:translocation/assembly module TamB domain-containing protein [Albitalea sp.]